jgi:hypothetical protein
MSKITTIAGVVGLVVAAGVASAQSAADTVYGVTQDNTLVRFNATTPGTIQAGVPIQGLASNEVIRGIDFRPATGELYALGSFSRLYRVNVTTGQATQVGGTLSPMLNGSSFGFDFNPTIDRIRVISDADQSLALNPITGAVGAVNGSLNYAAGDVNFGVNPNGVAAAYTNNFDGATTTTLYVLDTGLDVLAIQNVSTGALTTVGSVGVDLNDMSSFDISGATGIAYAAVRNVTTARTTFWTINLATGAGSFVGEVGGGSILTAMAVIPTPGAAAVLALGGLAMGRRRR